MADVNLDTMGDVALSADGIDVFIEKHADENGEVPDELMNQFLTGRYIPETGDTSSEDTGASPDSEKNAEGVTQPTATDPEKDEQPDILAKDGKNTIPFTVLEDARDQIKILTEEIATLKAQINLSTEQQRSLAEAQAKDAESGDTSATEEWLADFQEDYPEAAKNYLQVTKEMQELRATVDELRQEKQATDAQAEVARQEKELDDAVSSKIERYHEIKQSDHFWKWYDDQSEEIRALPKTPAIVTMLMNNYIAANPQTPAAAGDTADNGKQNVKTVAQKALDDAKSKQAPVNSLSDVSGVQSHTDEVSALNDMDPMSMFGKFQGKSSAEIERILQKVT